MLNCETFSIPFPYSVTPAHGSLHFLAGAGRYHLEPLPFACDLQNEAFLDEAISQQVPPILRGNPISVSHLTLDLQMSN